MRKSLLFAAAIIPLVVGGLALPAIAGSSGNTGPSDPPTIDLEAIPVKPVAGPLAVQGVTADEEDDARDGAVADEHGKGRGIEADDDAGFVDVDQDD